MSSPGFTGAGPSDFFSGGSMAAAPPQNNIITTVPTTTTTTTPTPTPTPHLHPSHPLYRTQQNLPAIFLDPSLPQRQTPTLIGKRTLAEFQSHQNLNNSLNYINNNHHLNLHNTHNLINNNNNNNHHNQLLSNFLLRSVKQRTLSPMTSLSHMDFSISPEFPTSSSGFPSQRYGMPYLNHLRQNPVNFTNSRTQLPITNSILPNTNRITYQNPNLVAQVNNNNNVGGVFVTNNELPEKKTMDHRLLQELEKQLLEDNDEEEGDAASVITNSEWSEAIQNLIDPRPAQSQSQAQAQHQAEAQTQAQKLVSSSPTSSTTSSNSSSCSVASPASNCSKQSLMEAATAISEGKLDSASEILSRLGQSSNPNGNSDQRFTDCMVSALKSRVNSVENPPPVAELFSREHAESTQLLFENCLCFKVALMAANQAILEAALEDKDKAVNGVKFCVLDFDVGNGKQHASLLHTLSARLGGTPVTIKLAAVAENGAGDERMKAVGELLLRQAERLGIGFEFKIVTHNELTRDSLGCDPDESLAVNFAFKLYRMPDESVSTENPRDELLRRVKALTPRVVTLVEQEMNTNTAPFGARVAELCSYYGALFDSVESTLGRDNSVRVKVEEGLSRKVGNSVACEGRDRVERCEVFGKWRARMSWAGFSLKPVNPCVTESIKARLGPGNRVTVKEENGGVCFGWMGRTLTVASTWR